MIDPDELAEAVAAWGDDTLAEIVGVYAYAPAGKTLGLPDIAVEIERIETLMSDPERFPMLNIQQAMLRVFDLSASFMVNQGRTEEDANNAASLLRSFAQRLTASIFSDNTLGGRVPAVSPLFSFDFVPQFVRYEDGTRGRQVVLSLSVAELIGD